MAGPERFPFLLEPPIDKTFHHTCRPTDTVKVCCTTMGARLPGLHETGHLERFLKNFKTIREEYGFSIFCGLERYRKNPLFLKNRNRPYGQDKIPKASDGLYFGEFRQFYSAGVFRRSGYAKTP